MPIRLEIGLKEFENMEVTICRRDSSEKHQVQIDKIEEIPIILQNIQDGLFNDAKTFMDDNTCTTNSFADFTKLCQMTTNLSKHIGTDRMRQS